MFFQVFGSIARGKTSTVMQKKINGKYLYVKIILSYSVKKTILNT